MRFEMHIVQVPERTFVADDSFDVAWLVHFERHIFLFASGETDKYDRQK